MTSHIVTCHPTQVNAPCLRYVHTDTSASTSLSLAFHLLVVCHSYKLHPHEWSVRGHLYKHITQRVSVDRRQRN